MKKLIKAIVLLFVFVMLTGCVTSTTKVTVTKTKNVTISIYMLTDDTKNIDVSKEFDTVSLVNRGFAIEKVSQDGYSGVKISKNYKNIDDLSSLEDVNIVISDIVKDGFNDSKYFKVRKSFFYNTYTANFKYKLASEIFNYANSHEGMDTSKLHTRLDETKFKFVAELPYGQIQSNAGSVEGNVLTWNLNSSEDNDITFAFDVYNLGHIGITFGTAFVLILTIIIIILVKTRAKRKEKRRLEKERKAQEEALKKQQEEEFKRLNNVPDIANVESTNMTPNKSLEFALEYDQGTEKKVIKNRKFVDVSSREEILDFDKNKPKESLMDPINVQAPMIEQTPMVQQTPIEQPKVEPTFVEQNTPGPIVDNVPQSKFIGGTQIAEPIMEPQVVQQQPFVDNVPQSKFMSNTPSVDPTMQALVQSEPEKITFLNEELSNPIPELVGAPKNDSPFDNEENLDSFLPDIAVNPQGTSAPMVDPTLAEFGVAPSAPVQQSVPTVDPTLAEFGDLFANAQPPNPQQVQNQNNTNKFL